MLPKFFNCVTQNYESFPNYEEKRGVLFTGVAYLQWEDYISEWKELKITAHLNWQKNYTSKTLL